MQGPLACEAAGARDGTESIGEAVSLHMIGHFNGHRGEINTLRGMQGMPTVMAAEDPEGNDTARGLR